MFERGRGMFGTPCPSLRRLGRSLLGGRRGWVRSLLEEPILFVTGKFVNGNGQTACPQHKGRLGLLASNQRVQECKQLLRDGSQCDSRVSIGRANLLSARFIR